MLPAPELAALEALFERLREHHYHWGPQTPEQLLKCRQLGRIDPSSFDPLVRFFGLGLEVEPEVLERCGIDSELLERIRSLHPCISRSGGHLVAHHHWPPRNGFEPQYVHFGSESQLLIEQIQSHLESFVGKRILDLGCGAGALALEVAALAERVCGLDISETAVQWARANAMAQGHRHLEFHAARIGDPEADRLVEGRNWQAAIFNPPMVVPNPSQPFPHRDGGHLGIELPRVFLDFAYRHLVPGGEVICLATNPIVGGRSLYFERFPKHQWEIREQNCLHRQFNQSRARKEKYAEQGISRIELWALHLVKRG